VILYKQGETAVVRAGEQDLAGRRVAVRAVPYLGDFGESRFRFDPIERVFSEIGPDGTVVAGPFDAEAWRVALAAGAVGAVLVGPSNPAEAVHGAYRAAAEGAARSGRGTYLLDPEPDGLPETPSGAFVAVFVLLPDRKAAISRLAAVADRGFLAGCLLPLISGWTDSAQWIEQAVGEASAAGARFLAPVSPAFDGTARRRIVEARAEVEPEAADVFFERIHHADAVAAAERARQTLVAACEPHGLATLPVRARGLAEPASNALAASRLEEKAQSEAHDEHRAALLHGAARWIDEFGRDLAVILREGNLRKIFPFGAELAREAEEALASGQERGASAGAR
jgi:hypothetical protein